MALTNFNELRASIADTLNREDLTGAIPDFITGCEQLVNYGTDDINPLRVREMEVSASLTGASGVFTLPADYLEYRSVKSNEACPVSLSIATPDFLDAQYPGGMATANAPYFSISGGTLNNYSSVSAGLNLTYYQKIPALSNANTTNWLLTKAPFVYLYGSLIHSAPYQREDSRVAMWAALFKQAMSGLQKTDNGYRFARVVSRVRGATP